MSKMLGGSEDIERANIRSEAGDASEPWGPWTMVFFTEKWGTGPGDAAPFPTKRKE